MNVNRTGNASGTVRPRAWRAAAALVAMALVVGVAGTPGWARQRAKGREHMPEKAKALIGSAIAALGGPRYLAVTAITSSGLFTPFSKGRATLPIEFVDTLVLPDKDRTEFGKKKNKIVQTNSGDAGWKFDGPRGVLERQTADEIRSFGRFVRGTIDNVLRSGWRSPGVTLRYVGREEFQPRQWVEVVGIDFPDKFSVEVLFDPDTKLPVASRYEDPDTNVVSEARYHQYIDHGGIQVPRIVDLYKGGVQTGRIVSDVVRHNPTIPPGHFDMPADLKGLAK